MIKAEDLGKMIEGELQKGMNPLIEYIYGEELSFTTLDSGNLALKHIFPDLAIDLLIKLSVLSMHEITHYLNFKTELMKPIDAFWSSFLSSEFLKKHKIFSGEQREKDRKPNPFDYMGVLNAQGLSNLYSFNFFDYERLKFIRAYPRIDDFLETTLKHLTRVCDFFKLKENPSSIESPSCIETGGWIPNDDSLALLTREDSKRPTYQFRIKEKKDGEIIYKEVTVKEIEEIRESIHKSGKALLNKKPVEWIIYDTKSKNPIVIPKKFEDASSLEKDGAIVIFAGHPTQNKEILAFMGDRAPASAISPLLLTEIHPESKTPFKKILKLKDELRERIKTRYFEMVLEFTFHKYPYGFIPEGKELKDVKIVGPPRPLI